MKCVSFRGVPAVGFGFLPRLGALAASGFFLFLPLALLSESEGSGELDDRVSARVRCV